MNTVLALADKVRDTEPQIDIENLFNHPVCDKFLHLNSCLAMVLNEDLQVLAFKDTKGILKRFGSTSPRIGDVFKCFHTNDMPGGCGALEPCRTCRALEAVNTSLEQNSPVSKSCDAIVENGYGNRNAYFQVNSIPFTFDEQRFILLLFQDITIHQKRAALERKFFHDINNIICGLSSYAQLLVHKKDHTDVERVARRIDQLTLRLAKEVEMQRSLLQTETFTYQPVWLDSLSSKETKE